jgi:hypothetical protein
MKKIILLFSVTAILFSCNQSDTNQSSGDNVTAIAPASENKVLRGEEVDESIAVTVEEMLQMVQGLLPQ